MTDNVDALITGACLFGVFQWALPGLVGGIVTAMIIYRRKTEIGMIGFATIALGWGASLILGWIVGGLTSMMVGNFLMFVFRSSDFGSNTNFWGMSLIALTYCIMGLCSGGLGSTITYWVISNNFSRPVSQGQDVP